MKNLTCRSSLTCTLCALFATAPAALAADVVLQKVPALTVEQTPAYPDNLARVRLGAKIDAVSGSATAGAASALLNGDPTARYTLASGKTTLLLSLPKIENINSVAVSSLGAKGNVTIATSNAKLPADSPQWQQAAQQELAGAVKANIGPSEAKYVRLTFDVTEAGDIAALGLYSTAKISDFTKPRNAEQDSVSLGLISYSRTDIHGKARALYVSSGSDLKQAHNVIDDQVGTSYNFAAEDGTPTTVIDLGKTSTVRRLSAVYAPRPGKMEFYVMQSLPNGASASDANVQLDDAAFAALKPVGAAEDAGAEGRASVDFPETSGRYVMVRWIPAAQQDASFSLAEVAAIGSANSQLLAANTSAPGASDDETAETQMTDGKTMLDGKTMIDAKDMPGEGPAEEAPQSPGEGPPPSLPQPPPFTFVPVLVPASP